MMRDYVGELIAGAVQRRVQQAVGRPPRPWPAARALPPAGTAARRLTALALNIHLMQLIGNGQERRPGNGKILKRTS
jgi:hypothetical protein